MEKKAQKIANLWGDIYNILPSDRMKLAKDFMAYADQFRPDVIKSVCDRCGQSCVFNLIKL